jgi:Cof subfamily protein (haloacid dehalogenase superfamily)
MAKSAVRLVIADVDGTLVTREKVLTAETLAAVKRLRDAGVAFTITSGRPPLGMRMITDALALTDPIAAFNGGVFARPDLSVIETHYVPADVTTHVIESLERHGLDCWLYTDHEWLVRDIHAPHIEHEQWTVKFAPVVVADFVPYLGRAVKLVGVSDDYDAVARCEVSVQRACTTYASATRSQPYYLDVTHPEANKGQVVTTLSELLSIPPDNIATIGDGPNDVLMFRKSGVSIAMGNASAEVQRHARFVTTANEEEGFANAVDKFILRYVPDEVDR